MNVFSRARAAAASQGRTRTALRVARSTLVVLAASFASYLVGMNVFLETRLFRGAISSSPGSLLVDYRAAYSLWPGRIHVEGLAIRGRDSSVEWILRLERCDFRVSFFALIRRKFHASHVNGDGLSLRIRLREDTPVRPEEARALPPVPGFLDPPLADSGPPPAPLTDATYNLWSIELDDVDANHVRELWIDTVRYAGDLEVRGRWLFRPLRWLDVGPTTVSLRSLDVSYGGVQPWLSGAAGELAATIHPFALQEVLGADMLDRVSVDGTVRGTLRVANVLGRVLEAPDPGVSHVTRADDARVDARIHLDHGVLRSGTQVLVDRFATVAYAGAIVLDASLTAQALVDDGGTGHLRVRGSAFRAEQGASESLRATSVAATVASRDLDLALWGKGIDLLGSVEGEGLLARLDQSTLGMSHFSVAATTARLQPGAEPLAGTFTLAAENLLFERKEVTGGANLQARLVVSRSASAEERIDLSGSEVRLRNAYASIKGARVLVPSLEVQARSLAFVGSHPVGRVAVETPNIELPLKLVPNALLLLPKIVTIEGGRARATLAADVDVEHMAATGEARVVVQALQARVGEQPLAGELRLEVRARESDESTVFSGSTLAFDGTVGVPPAPWWARATLLDAALNATSGLRFRGQVTANAKDASPLAAIIAKNTAIPRFVLDAISTEGLVATGNMLVSPSTFQARSVTAHATGIDVGFELAELGAEQEWALLLDVGAVCAGIDVSGSQTDVLLFGARPWFEKKSASLRAVERRYE